MSAALLFRTTRSVGLTEAGQRFLNRAGPAFDDRPEEIATILVDREKGRPVRKLELRAADGRLLSQADTKLKPRPAPRRRSA